MARVSTPMSAPLTAGDVLTHAELRHLRRLSAIRSAWLVAHAWGIIAAAMALYALWPSPLTLLAAILVIGGRQMGLAVLMHEGAHWRLSERAKVNTYVARWLCAAPLGIDLTQYRRRHHLHHRHTRQADDPDLALAARYPVSAARFWLGVAADLSGVTAARRVLAWRPEPDGLRPTWLRWYPTLAANTVLLAALAALGHARLFGLLWLLPLATWYQLAMRLRDAAEHGAASEDDDPLRNTRTLDAGWIARALLAPYWVSFHLEHHLLVFVPCWKLSEARALLVAKGHGARMERAPGYTALIRRLTAA